MDRDIGEGSFKDWCQAVVTDYEKITGIHPKPGGEGYGQHIPVRPELLSRVYIGTVTPRDQGLGLALRVSF
jgi:hypothetical protein